MKNVNVLLKDLKTIHGFEIVEKGTCPETGIDNRILSARVGTEVFTRKIDRIDWAQGEYIAYMSGETRSKKILELHQEDLKEG